MRRRRDAAALDAGDDPDQDADRPVERLGVPAAPGGGTPGRTAGAAAYGADISQHRASVLDAGMIRSADLVLAMEKYHIDKINDLLFFRCKYALLLGTFAANRENPEVEDPYGSPLGAYESCAREIVACMPGVIDHIRRQVGRKAS